MQIHNPSKQSRLCVSLGEHLEPFEVRDVPPTFERCDGCRCVVTAKKAARKEAAKDKS